MLRSVLEGIEARNFATGEGFVRRAHQAPGNHLFVWSDGTHSVEAETDLPANTMCTAPQAPSELVAWAKSALAALIAAEPKVVDGNTQSKETELLTATATRSGVSGWGSFLCDQVVEKGGWKIRFPFSLPAA